jgi:hypothetical protein
MITCLSVNEAENDLKYSFKIEMKLPAKMFSIISLTLYLLIIFGSSQTRGKIFNGFLLELILFASIAL